jgi:hypothetical protein
MNEINGINRVLAEAQTHDGVCFYDATEQYRALVAGAASAASLPAMKRADDVNAALIAGNRWISEFRPEDIDPICAALAPLGFTVVIKPETGEVGIVKILPARA